MPSYFAAYRNKLANKLWGVVRVPSATSAAKGRVLVSYLTGPFTLAPGEHFTDPHTNYWECAEIVRLLGERGYEVDIIDAYNRSFVPRRPYRALIDVRSTIERLAPILPRGCIKILHITSCDGAFQNARERERRTALARRRGIRLPAARPEVESHNPTFADYLEGFGNEAVRATYASYGKPITPIPISVAREFDFPAYKDFAAARREFLWFGGGGAVLKGLDLLLEAFAQMPEYALHIVGPAAYEPEFARAYARELSLPNITRYPRPKLSPDGSMRCGEVPFESIANRCAALIYPSASEGTSGAVVQAMHAGVIPVVTPITGLYEDAPATLLPASPSVEDLVAAARAVAAAAPEELAARARGAWEYARGHYTKAAFSAAYARFLDSIGL